ncbi:MULTISPECIES: hypothetical protein [Cytobacillus]|uniref:hypothetical protein n=1 Tax=Cytobacillus TaxID=2675230 RepID=UPI00203D143E|nr:hypothetical protein [Cytobacillus firmus]MCM3705287.1 hypothetical protein [Cytobacillus firmus]
MRRKPKSPKIIFNNLNVDLLENNSGIFMGKNRQFYWSSAGKTHSGFGAIYGQENEISHNTHFVLKETAENQKEGKEI